MADWQRARLIPVSGIGSEQEAETRATSALLLEDLTDAEQAQAADETLTRGDSSEAIEIEHVVRGRERSQEAGFQGYVGKPYNDAAVIAAVNQGVVMVVAAGNDNANACTGSPNRVAEAITVGSTTTIRFL